jgi:hypothetical protein
MRSPEQMESVTFRPTRGQRRYRLQFGVFFTLIGVAGLVLVPHAGHDSAGAVVGGVVVLLVGLIVLASRKAHTTIDADGLSTSSLFGRHSCNWSEVSNITCKTDRGEGPNVSRIKIHRNPGRSFTLPAPTDSSSAANRNSEFGLQFATIRSYWESTARPASHDQS